MDEATKAELKRYREEYFDNDDATRWAMQRMQLNHLQSGLERAQQAADDARASATLAGNIAKLSIEEAEGRLGARIDDLAKAVTVMGEEAKTIARGVDELRTNVGGVLELAESAVTVAGSAQRTLSNLASKHDQTARNTGAPSKGSGPPSAG